MYKNKNGGFSLLELIVVIAIMAVLGGIVIGNSNYSKSAQVKKYTELTDGFMRKARTEIMSKNTVSGVCLYEKEGCYYIESYKEKENGGTYGERFLLGGKRKRRKCIRRGIQTTERGSENRFCRKRKSVARSSPRRDESA